MIAVQSRLTKEWLGNRYRVDLQIIYTGEREFKGDATRFHAIHIGRDDLLSIALRIDNLARDKAGRNCPGEIDVERNLYKLVVGAARAGTLAGNTVCRINRLVSPAD